MLEQGAEERVFEPTEREMVTNVLNLDERHVDAVLTLRSDVVFLDVRDSIDVNRERLNRVHTRSCPFAKRDDGSWLLDGAWIWMRSGGRCRPNHC